MPGFVTGHAGLTGGSAEDAAASSPCVK